MAIKIIKNSMIDPIEKVCDNCGSIFSFNYQDIEAYDRQGIFGLNFHERFIICPVCKARNFLEKVQDHKGNEASQVLIDEGEANETI